MTFSLRFSTLSARRMCKENTDHFQEGELETENTVKFLIENRGNQKRDKTKLKDGLTVILQASHFGLPSHIIRHLTTSIIFEDQYDIVTRRKLLYACIPKTDDFPYAVIPLAVSSAASPGISSTWQLSIMNWLSGLLQYRVIDESHQMLHICYTTLFTLLTNLRICGVVCNILYHITRREDVTPYRTQVLMRLEKKIGFCQHIPNILRLYMLFRPDLVVSRLDQSKRFPPIPKSLLIPLQNARQRLEGDGQDHARSARLMWPEYGIGRKANPFHEKNALPQPEILVYADSLEEKKKKKISVLQFRRLADMISKIHDWKDWQWPNSSACLLWKPSAISLFKPDDMHVKVAITNWLELALRTELIEELGNPSKERQESLLDACILLVKQTETLVPAVYVFLIEFFTKWDKYSHMSRVLELISVVPFISPVIFFETFLESFSHVLTTASLPLFCAAINAFANTSLTWAIQAHREKRTSKSKVEVCEWPYEFHGSIPLEGIHFLSIRLERLFLFAIQRFGTHPMLINSCISYYTKVNMCCEELSLPLFVFPSLEFVFNVLVSSDLVAIHRIGNLIANMQNIVETVKRYETVGDERRMQSVVMSVIESINFTVMVYLDSTATSKGFSDRWNDLISQFVGQRFITKLTSLPNIHQFASVCRDLQYLPFVTPHMITTEGHSDRENITKEVIEELEAIKLDGILNCVMVYMRKE